MTYFPDLSKYRYFSNESRPNLLNIGWLDGTGSYSKGAVDLDLLRKLFRLCNEPVNRSMGWHYCAYCKVYPVSMTLDGHTMSLGDAEIRVTGKNGIVYAAPTLICHYIQAHEYCPPDDFLVAVRKL
jgi:hypothetical protein